MGLVDDIKNQVKKSGTNKGKFLYFRPGNKVRVRFLNDMDEGMKVSFHDNFSRGINTPCQELFGRSCKYCGDEDLRTRDQYIWSVWDHEAKEVKLLMSPVNSFSPVPALVAMYETYSTLKDRDYVIQKTGQGQGSSYSVVPMDKAKFSNEKAKPYTQSKVLSLLDKGFSDDSSDDEDEPKKSVKKAKPRTTEDLDDNNSYSEYTAKELYELCVERDIEAEKKKPVAYYVKLLEEADAEEEEEEEENEEKSYDDMTPKELYQLCKERELDVKPKQNKAYYVEKLEEDDGESGGWEDDDDEEDEWE